RRWANAWCLSQVDDAFSRTAPNNRRQQSAYEGIHPYMKSPNRGFTLIELMITVAVVAILAAIGFPSYARYVARSNRAAAQSYMLEVSDKQQRYLLDARTFAANLTELSATPPNDVARNYTIATAKVGAAGFQVTATPTGGQVTNDAECGTLTIDEAGTK